MNYAAAGRTTEYSNARPTPSGPGHRRPPLAQCLFTISGLRREDMYGTMKGSILVRPLLPLFYFFLILLLFRISSDVHMIAVRYVFSLLGWTNGRVW